MPIGGERPKKMGAGYINDPISEYASAFRDVAHSILEETGYDIYSEPAKALMFEAANEKLRNFFIEKSADEANMTPAQIKDHREMMNEQYINDREAILEYAPQSQFNPVVGMTAPIHKNLLMNCIYDKGPIQKAVAVSPKFTISMEQRILVDLDGTEYDMFKHQNKIKEVMDKTAPVKEVEMNLPENATTDVLNAIGATTKDNLSISSFVSAVKVNITKSSGTEDVWIPVNYQFTPYYGELDRVLMVPVSVTHEEHTGAPITDFLSGHMKDNRFVISCAGGKVKAVKIAAKKDTSNGLSMTPQVKWKVKTDIVEIPNANPINTPISPEETKDIAALYQVDQLTKIMSMIKDVMENYKDDTIKAELDHSYATMDPSLKRNWKFDFAPRDGYDLDHVTWRNAVFMDTMESYIVDLLQIYNDPNMEISVIGRTDLIRKIKPTQYTFESPGNIGPMPLEYRRTVTTSNNMVFNFLSSAKIKDNDELTITLKPMNSERIVYRIYDYQFLISNEIRNAGNHALPGVHVFDRWKFVSYQPVQAKVKILNPSGLK